jgi:hypothetical protein
MEHSSTVSDVDTEIQAIRDVVNEGVFVNNIERHGFEWDMACASMDMIGDAQLAIDAFDDKPASAGQRYLEVYGLFQAFFLQQHAIKDLAAALRLADLKVLDDPDMKEVRELRNKYVGHPSKHDVPKPTTYHGLTRITVTSDEITGWTFPRFRTETISISASIAKQAQAAVRVLKQLQQRLEDKRKDYILKFDGKELPTDYHTYEFEKLYLWALQPKSDTAALADIAQKMLERTLKDMKDGIEERYSEPEGVGDLVRTIEKAEFCLEHMRTSISRGARADSFEDEVYMDALKQAYEEIVEACAAINETFKAG